MTDTPANAKPALTLLLAQPRGFCAGVERAIEIVERSLQKFGAPVYVRHEIVHNDHVVNELRGKGAVFLDDVTVSRRHAEFRINEGEFEVFDVGSLNGTYVNREPRNSQVLTTGDEIQIGKFRLVFLAAPKND